MAGPLRRTGISVLGGIPWGAHICLFYETKQDLLDAQVGFFEAGLQDNEFCVWVVSDSGAEQDARLGLARVVPDFDRLLAEGHIEFLLSREWYLKEEKFDLRRITDGWREKLRGALAKGFDGMRVSGTAFWLATDYWDDFLAYERELGHLFEDKCIIGLCTYSLGDSQAVDVLDVAHAHNMTIVRRRGGWEVMEAFKAGAESNALTDRELEVLTWVARGKSAWEIGEILHITKRTVDEHVQKAMRKLGATNRTQAAAIAIRDRIIDPSAPLP